MVTNKPTDQAEKVVNGFGLSPLLPQIIGPDYAERRKTAPEHLFVALERLGREPSEAVIVGDGITCRPDHLVDTVSSLAKLVTEI